MDTPMEELAEPRFVSPIHSRIVPGGRLDGQTTEMRISGAQHSQRQAIEGE